MRLEKNVGSADRVLRLGVGMLMIYLGLSDNVLIQDQLACVVLAAFGVVVLLSAIVGACPLYGLAGFDSTGRDGEE